MENAEKLRLSPSALNAFKDCNYKFLLAYIKKVKPKIKGNIYSSFGSAIHKCIQLFYEAKTFEDRNSVLINWPTLFISDIENKNIKISETDRSNFISTGKRVLLDFYDRQNTDGLLKDPHYLEQKNTLDMGEFLVVGIVDIAYEYPDGIDIVDFKTNSKAKTQKEVDEDTQLTLYCWLYWRLRGIIPKRLGLHYLKLDKKVYTSRTEDQLYAFTEYLMGFYTQVSTMKKWETNSKHCFLCDFKYDCPETESHKIRIV